MTIIQKGAMVVVCVFTACVFQASSQTSIKASAKPKEIAIKTVDLDGGKILAGLPPSTVVGSPVQCSIAGTTFLDIYAQSGSTTISNFPELWSVDHVGGIRHLKRNLPINYKTLLVLSTFADEHKLVSLIEARNKLSLNRDDTRLKDFYLTVSNEDGSSDDPLLLALPFIPRKVAKLQGGRYIVLGLDEANQTPVLATLNEDGALRKILDLDDRTYSHDKSIQQTFNVQPDADQREKRRMLLASISYSAFVPYGSKVLFLQPASNLPSKIIGDDGLVGELSFRLPAGYLLNDILVSDPKGPILARLESEADLRSFAEKRVIENPKQVLAEFSRNNGSLIRLIKVAGPQPGEVSCATNQELTAIYFPLKKESDLTPTATSIPEQLIFAQSPF